MISQRLNTADLQFLNKYSKYYKNSNYKELFKRVIINIWDFIAEAIIMILWWACVIAILVSFGAKKLFSELSVTRYIMENLYVSMLYAVSKLLDFIQYVYPAHSRKSIIYDKGSEDPYLERYYLLLTDRESFKFNVFFHKFMKGDEDDIHDHPWGFFHIIISGGYWEYVTVNEDGETLDQGIKKVWRGAGHYNMATPDYKHRIVLGDEKPWTLFIPFKKAANWGFWVPLIWQNNGPCIEGSTKDDKNMNCTQWRKIDHETYLERKKKQTFKKTN